MASSVFNGSAVDLFESVALMGALDDLLGKDLIRGQDRHREGRRAQTQAQGGRLHNPGLIQ